MWSIFTTSQNNVENVLKKIDDVKNYVFQTYEQELKIHFAKKMVVYFDNLMILNKSKGLHLNLMEALSKSEKDMKDISAVFPDIELFWFHDENEHSFMIKNLGKDCFEKLDEIGLNLVHTTNTLSGRMKELRYESFQTILFSAELVNYAKDWIDFTPSSEERSRLQAVFMYLDMKVKKENLDLYEQIQLEKNIYTNETFVELYQKIHKIMPKIEQTLEKEWKYGLFEDVKNNLTIEQAKEAVQSKIEDTRVKKKVL